jgi:hypothetical protein
MADIRTRALGPSLFITMLCCGLAACASESGSGSGVVAAESTASSVTAAGDGGATAVDACSLLSAQEVATFIDATVEGKSTSNNPAAPGCSWENPDTYQSVTIDIGGPGTAPNNTLPPLGEPGFPVPASTPGPDGMRFVAGAVEFAAGERYNSVQVATPVTMSADESNATGVDLARKISPQIPK